MQTKTLKSIEDVLAYDTTSHTPEEAQSAKQFIEGHQWSEELKQLMISKGRRCITINVLHRLIGKLRADSGRDLSLAEEERLEVIVYRLCSPGQTHINLMMSSVVDRMGQADENERKTLIDCMKTQLGTFDDGVVVWEFDIERQDG